MLFKCRDIYEWHRQFAWFPLSVVKDGEEFLAWLQYVETRRVWGGWENRLPKEEVEEE